jgi:hypothetical protein
MELLDLFSIAPQAVELDNGKTVYIRRLSAAHNVAWFEYLTQEEEKRGGRERNLGDNLDDACRLLSLTICDKDGKDIAEPDKLFATLKTQDAEIVNGLARIAYELNGLGGKGAEAVKKK